MAGIAATGRGGGGLVYDVSGAALLPGLIDTHVHIGWHFDRESGRTHSGD